MARTARTLPIDTCKALIALVLLIIVLATVLITPDPTDDVEGIVRPHRTLNPSLIAFSLVQLLTLFGAERLYISRGSGPSSPSVLRFLCVFRC